MSFGFELRDASNRMMSSGSEGGVFIEELILAAGNSGSKTYNTDARLSSRLAMVIQIVDGTHTWSAGSSGGFPMISWSSYAPLSGNGVMPTTLQVFAQ
jgi:hypothetical protein